MASQVPARKKLLYGVGEFAIAAKNAALNQYLLFFYVDVIRLSPVLVGAAIFVGRLWDAVTDPLAGYVSDTTRSRYGRRRPYVLFSALPLGLGFFLLFAPRTQGEWSTVLYLGAMYIVLMTAFTFFATPYLAWGAELSDDPHERTTIVQVRSVFGVLGGLIGGAMPIAIVRRFESEANGFAVMGLVLGSLLTITALITGLGVRERQRVQPPRPSLQHFFFGLRHTLRNQWFRLVFCTFCLMTVALSLGNSLQIFVVKYWLGLYDFFPWIAASFALSFVLSFPFWARISRNLGKHTTMRIGLLLGAVVPFGWLVLPPQTLAPMIGFAVVGGFAMGAVTVVVSAAMDAIDYDASQTGERREGAYFGIWTLGLKTSGAAGALLGGVVLRAVGFDTEAVVEPHRVWWLLWILGPLQAFAHLFGFLMLGRLPVYGSRTAELAVNVPPKEVAGMSGASSGR